MMTVMKHDRGGARVAAAAAAARAAVAAPPAANYDESTMSPTAFVEKAEERLPIDAADDMVNDVAALPVLKDSFADGGARFLKSYHGVDMTGMNDLECSRLAVGMALAEAAKRLDLTPEMVFAATPAGAPGVGGYSRSVLLQEPMRMCRLGKERSEAAAHGPAPPAAAGAAPVAAAPAAAAPATAATATAAALVDRTAQLNVPHGNLPKRTLEIGFVFGFGLWCT